jgi:hypothetical protein
VSQRGRPAKRERREAARQARVESHRRRVAAKRRRRMITGGLLALALLAAGAAGGWFYLGGREDIEAETRAAGCSGIQTFADQGRTHINVGDPHVPYNSNPPTSGPHAQVAPWGFYDEPLAPEIIVHNLEHGGTVIHYNNLPDDQIRVLEKIADDYPEAVLALPNNSIDKPIVLTAWTRMQECDRVSETVVRAFIESRCNKSPEPVAQC